MAIEPPDNPIVKRPGDGPLPPVVQAVLDGFAAPLGPRPVDAPLLVVPSKVSNMARAVAKAKPRPVLRTVALEDYEPPAPRLADAENVDAATLLEPAKILERINAAYAIDGLTAPQRAMLVVIAFRDGFKGRGCRMTLANMMRDAGIANRKTAIDALRALVNMGHVVRFKPTRTALVSYYFRPPLGAKSHLAADPARCEIVPSLGAKSHLATEPSELNKEGSMPAPHPRRVAPSTPPGSIDNEGWPKVVQDWCALRIRENGNKAPDGLAAIKRWALKPGKTHKDTDALDAALATWTKRKGRPSKAAQLAFQEKHRPKTESERRALHKRMSEDDEDDTIPFDGP